MGYEAQALRTKLIVSTCRQQVVLLAWALPPFGA